MRTIHDPVKNDFLVRNAERLRDRNPDAYHNIASDVIYTLVQNNMEDMIPEQAAYDPLNLPPEIVQQYMNARGARRKKTLGRLLGGAAAAAGTSYLAGDADTEGYYRRGTSQRLAGQPAQYVSTPNRKTPSGNILSPHGTFPSGAPIDPVVFQTEISPSTQRYVDVDADRNAGQMSRLMFLLRRIMGDIYKGKRYE